MRASKRSGVIGHARRGHAQRKTRAALASAISACGALLATAPAAHAVNPIAYTGGTYAEDFNALPSAPGNIGTFTGNGPFDMPNGIPQGWSFGRLAGAQDLQFVVGNGSSAALGLVISAGLDNDPDRALASASTTPSQARFGLTLVNNTQETFNQFTIQFANEQWRTGGGTSGSSNTFAYSTGTNAADINTGTFTQVVGLHVGSIAQSATATGPVNGNDAGFRRVKGGTVNGFTWGPGEQLVLRWDDVNAQGAEDWLGIDDFTFSAGHVRNLRWNRTSGNWNQDNTNTAWLDEANAPASFQTGDNVIFGNIASDAVITLDLGTVSPTITTISNAAHTYTFAGPGGIGTGSVVKTGAGNVVFVVPNTYEGTASLTGGTVETQDSGAFSTGAVALSDITWKATTATQAFSNTFNNSGTVTIHADQPLGLGTATLNGGTNATLIFENAATDPLIIPNMVSFAGNVHAKTGVIKASSTDGDLFSNTTVLTIDPGATVDFSANGESLGAIQGGGTLAVGDVETATESFLNFNAPGDHTFSGVITGTGGNGFIMRGGGTMTLTGPSTFTTPVVIETGAIAVGANVLPDVAGPLGQNSTAILLGNAPGSVTNSAALLISGPFEIARPITVPANTNAGTITLGGNTDATSRFTGPITLERAVQLTSATTGTNVVEFAGGNISSLNAPDAPVTKVGPGVVLLSGTHAYTGPTIVQEGTLRLSGSIADSQGVTAMSGGTFEAAATTTVKSLTVEDGGLARIAPTGGPAATNVLKTASLTLQPTAAVDLTNGAMVVDYTPVEASPLETIRAAVASGYANGAWTGPGIRSSTAAATPGRAVGYGEASAVLGPAGGNFLGTAVDGDAVLVRHTLRGDANLDARVDFIDLVALAQNYNNLTGDRVWTQGDFTYDGVVDFNDLVALAQNYNTFLPSAAAAIPGAPANFDQELARAFAQVPEPTAAATLLLTAAACGFAPRSRRRRK
jgi:autotransporter-associated beta strand protein